MKIMFEYYSYNQLLTVTKNSREEEYINLISKKYFANSRSHVFNFNMKREFE